MSEGHQAGSRVIAVIPARGGSKRVPRKNIRLFLGEPLIARTVRLLQQSGVFSRIVVSTDDAEIAAVAVAAGAEVPFMREATLANDHASTAPVIRDAIERLATMGDTPDIVCAVYPAAVLAVPDDLRRAVALMQETAEADYVIPVTSFGYPIQRALRRHADSSLSMFQPAHYEARSQDLEPAYHDAGQYYVGARAAWLSDRPFFSAHTRTLLIPRWRVQDIDTLDDWTRAEQIVRLQSLADEVTDASR
ncbi:pseudaminic acid cytidylyltransferase [Gemmatimonas sp.]|uniref:pseudaminic acid cytidylyltransferase n=1 Tax=Gemmatimonas sp. TaxID=1962908 RepID=UPI00286A9644|nr:pseudaminic acid cytidylyltransferase [Gemmatimonas sp.]